MHIISNKINIGTAKAFTQGIQYALALGIEYLWLLDDDLLPQMDALEQIYKVWEDIEDPDKKRHVILLSNRIDKKIYWYAFINNKPHLVIGEKNQFRSFHIFYFGHKILIKFNGKKYDPNTKDELQTVGRTYGLINAAYYGGMFFHTDIISNLGYPNERFVVYMDDFDFSHRNILKGGKIFFIPRSVIKDQEQSWNNVQKKFAFLEIAQNKNYPLLYYSIRNRVYFELQYNVNNYLIYAINLMIYSLIVMCFAIIFLKFKNILVYLCAIRDGLLGNMGVNQHYPLL